MSMPNVLVTGQPLGAAGVAWLSGHGLRRSHGARWALGSIPLAIRFMYHSPLPLFPDGPEKGSISCGSHCNKRSFCSCVARRADSNTPFAPRNFRARKASCQPCAWSN